MLFARSGICMILGLGIMMIAFFLSHLIWIEISLLLMIPGIIFVIYSLAAIYWRAQETTLIYPLDDPKVGQETLWLYIFQDYDAIFTPAVRKFEKFSYNEKQHQQIRDFRSYRLGNWSVKIVPEGVGTSVDVGMCLYASHAKREWGVKNILDLRKLFKQEKAPQEELMTVKEFEEMKENERQRK